MTSPSMDFVLECTIAGLFALLLMWVFYMYVKRAVRLREQMRKVSIGSVSATLSDLTTPLSLGVRYFEFVSKDGEVVILHFDPPESPGYCHVAYSKPPDEDGLYNFFTLIVSLENAWKVDVAKVDRYTTEVTHFVSHILLGGFRCRTPVISIRTLKAARERLQAPEVVFKM